MAYRGFSLLLNEGSGSKTNNYCNLFATGRYVEDGFNTTEDGDYQTWYYQDLGGKLEFEFGALAFLRIPEAEWGGR